MLLLFVLGNEQEEGTLWSCLQLCGDLLTQLDLLSGERRQVEAEVLHLARGLATDDALEEHDGLIPHRPIYGQANLAEAKELLSDGVPVMPLPFTPRKRTN